MTGTAPTTPRRVLLGMAAVLALVGLLVAAVAGPGNRADRPPTGPVAAVHDDRLAAVPPRDIPARLDLLAELGVTTARIDIRWDHLAPRRPADGADPADPAYDWRRLDTTMRGLAERNITAIATVHGTPAWAASAAGRTARGGRAAAPDPAHFAAVMAAIARRYDGTHLPPGASTPLPLLRHMELWSAPNLARGLAPQAVDGSRFAVDHYAQMVHLAYAAIKRVNPSATVIVGAGAAVGHTDDGHTAALTLLRGLRRHGVPMDAYSQHIAPGGGDRATPSLSDVSTLLRELDLIRPTIPLHITGAGPATAPAAGTAARRPGERQWAALLTRTYTAPQLQSQRVATVVWDPLQAGHSAAHGLLRADGSASPQQAAMAQVIATQQGSRLDEDVASK